MKIINELYQDVEEILNKLVYYTIEDRRELKDAERDSLTEAYDLLIQTLTCLSDASRFRKEEEPYVVSAAELHKEYFKCPRTYPEAIWPNDEEIDFSKVQSYYTSNQKGEEVPEGTPIDNSNHTYFVGDERKFNWDIANAIKKCSESNTVNYDNFYITHAGGNTIIIKQKGWDME